MQSLPIANPFPGAGCFLVRETSSTQDEARRLAKRGFPAGSLVVAERQSAGRGRFPERRWQAEEGKNILFTLWLDPSCAFLPALPLRIGAALCRATLAEAARRGTGLDERDVRLKWPNDLLIRGRKAAGILCEAGGEGVFAGIGINCNQESFPRELETSVTSLAIEFGAELDRWAFLERFLGELKAELERPGWRAGVEELLWKRGERVSFVPGLPGDKRPVEGVLSGIDEEGSLVIATFEGGEPQSFADGELRRSANDTP
jgi:BirA family biotin operon repressor/biotin-[acetyl-CoA-carboxylase] ligase